MLELDKLLIEADSDSFLKGIIEVDKAKQRSQIYHNGELAGFYTPRQTDYKNRKYWRTGAIYIKPEYRKKGLASGTITSFFSDKQYGLAYIDPTNTASLNTFTKCGFKEDGKFLDKRTGNTFIRMVKEPVELKPAFLSW